MIFAEWETLRKLLAVMHEAVVIQMGIHLFSHNQTAYELAAEMLRNHGRAAIIHPTGTGKSMIAFKLAEENPFSRVLWLAPSAYIYRTQLENLERGFCGARAVFQNILFLTYSKLMQMDGEALADIKPDYVVLDEFHRCGAKEWGRGVNALLSAFPDARILGLSATNIRYLDNQRDMAAELFGGFIASEMTLGEAVARRILPSPVYVLAVYSWQEELSKWKKKAEGLRDRGLKEQSEKILQKLRRALERSEGLDQVFERHMKNRSGKYIVFCSGREHMEEMKACVPEWFGRVDPNPHVYAVRFDSPDSDREFAAFKEDNSGHLKLLFCIDLLNEGVHVDGIDGVILLRPTVSPALYLQQIGRSLSAGNHTSSPVIFDIVNNFENLCSIDFLKNEVEAAAFMRGQGEGQEAFAGSFQIIDEAKDCRKLFAKLQKSLSASWDAYYGAAKTYYEANGHLNVPKNYVADDGLSLGSWIQTQRRVHAGKIGGSLSDEQIRRLSGIGMIWESPFQRGFERGCQALGQYRARYGNGDVKADYVTEDGYRLGRWVSNLRQKGRRMDPSDFLTADQLEKLKAAGMIWDKNAWQWEQNYKAVKEYYQTHGNLDLPKSSLRAWLDNQKAIYAGKNPKAAPLTEEQVKKLEAVGVEWEKGNDRQWRERYRLAEAYYKMHGNLRMPAAYVTEDGRRLGRWVRRQREQSRKHALNEERRELLSRIGFEGDVGSYGR